MRIPLTHLTSCAVAIDISDRECLAVCVCYVTVFLGSQQELCAVSFLSGLATRKQRLESSRGNS